MPKKIISILTNLFGIKNLSLSGYKPNRKFLPAKGIAKIYPKTKDIYRKLGVINKIIQEYKTVFKSTKNTIPTSIIKKYFNTSAKPALLIIIRRKIMNEINQFQEYLKEYQEFKNKKVKEIFEELTKNIDTPKKVDKYFRAYNYQPFLENALSIEELYSCKLQKEKVYSDTDKKIIESIYSDITFFIFFLSKICKTLVNEEKDLNCKFDKKNVFFGFTQDPIYKVILNLAKKNNNEQKLISSEDWLILIHLSSQNKKIKPKQVHALCMVAAQTKKLIQNQWNILFL